MEDIMNLEILKLKSQVANLETTVERVLTSISVNSNREYLHHLIMQERVDRLDNSLRLTDEVLDLKKKMDAEHSSPANVELWKKYDTYIEEDIRKFINYYRTGRFE